MSQDFATNIQELDEAALSRQLESLAARSALSALDALISATPEDAKPAAAAREARDIARRVTASLQGLADSPLYRD